MRSGTRSSRLYLIPSALSIRGGNEGDLSSSRIPCILPSLYWFLSSTAPPKKKFTMKGRASFTARLLCFWASLYILRCLSFASFRAFAAGSAASLYDFVNEHASKEILGRGLGTKSKSSFAFFFNNPTTLIDESILLLIQIIICSSILKN